ncbi:MAG: glucokinase [Thiotrichales bacterium]
MAKHLIAGDIGGTKCNLGAYVWDDRLVSVKQASYPSREFAHFDDLLADFVGEGLRIDALALGVAGPVRAGRCQTTNLPWHLAEPELAARHGVQSVRLLNDLEATALGMRHLSRQDWIRLNPAAIERSGTIAVIAAGTGLGEAILAWDGRRHRALATEGGHADFAPRSERDIELLRWLRHRFPHHVSVERVLGGPGIALIYQHICESRGVFPDACMAQLEPSDLSARISHCALNEGDPVCLDALRWFVELYGAEAGNLALRTLALGGVYIGGGIAPKLRTLIDEGGFMEAFFAKGRFAELLRQIDVRLCLNPETALLGAAFAAVELLAERN